MRFVLASASPRRAELLSHAGYQFDVVPANIDEQFQDKENPHEYVTRMALDKASVVASAHTEQTIIAADTVVVVDDMLFGKPRSEVDAARMLRRLSGRTHTVLTAVVVRRGKEWVAAVELSYVSFAKLDDQLISEYIATGEPADKAGAYGVQGNGALLVSRIDGSYTNVVGLPLAVVDRLINELKAVTAAQ